MIDIPSYTDHSELRKDSLEENIVYPIDINRILDENALNYKNVKEANRNVTEEIEMRKRWDKYGLSKNDPPGINSATTFLGEEIFLDFVTRKQKEAACEAEDPLAKPKEKLIKCRHCQGNHWTFHCPLNPKKSVEKELASQLDNACQVDGAERNSKSVKKFNGKQTKVPKNNNKVVQQGEMVTIKVTNISKDAAHTDLKDLFKEYSSIRRIFLVMDKETGISKGVAFINFQDREQAASAIQEFNGHGFFNLILRVTWARNLCSRDRTTQPLARNTPHLEKGVQQQQQGEEMVGFSPASSVVPSQCAGSFTSATDSM